MEISKEDVEKIKIVLCCGLDDYLWTLPNNFKLCNDLRKILNMDEITEEFRILMNKRNNE